MPGLRLLNSNMLDCAYFCVSQIMRIAPALHKGHCIRSGYKQLKSNIAQICPAEARTTSVSLRYIALHTTHLLFLRWLFLLGLLLLGWRSSLACRCCSGASSASCSSTPSHTYRNLHQRTPVTRCSDGMSACISGWNVVEMST